MSWPIRCDSRARNHSDDLPSSKPGTAPVPKGRALELGADATYDISDRVAGEEQPQLEVLPITMYVTEYAERQFCQIAVNARYICYGLRAGQVRVLHKDTASRALLRGHTAQIADMRFSPATNADILASFGVDGNLLVKKIVSPAGGDGDIEEKALLRLTVTTDVAASDVPLTPRVRWLSKTRIVASYGDGVFAVDVDPKASEAKTVALDLAAGADAPAGVAVVAPIANKPAATDLAVAPGANGRLAVAHADGSVRVWSPVDAAFAQDSAFTPFDDAPDAPLASVHFASEDALVVGGENNGALAMWSLPPPNDDMTSSPEHVQTLTFAPSDDVFNFALCAAPGARLVLVSNLKKQAVYAVHYAETASRGFDYVAEFSTTMPVLSFTARREDAADDAAAAGPGGALQLYCMQTQAIQQYALAVDRCRPEACDDDEAAEEADLSEEEEESESEVEEEAAPAPAPAAAPATPPAEAPKAAKQDSASKLLTPGELMSMAAGAQDVKPSADKPEEEPEPAPKARPAPFAKSARPKPSPPQGSPPPFPPPPGRPPPPGHMEALLGGLREQIYNDIAGFVAAQQAEVREERAAREAAERERQKQLLTAVSAAITRDLPVQIEKILKKELKGIAGEIGKVMAATKAKGADKGDAGIQALTAALPKALAGAMTSAVVPKFEKATSEMFAQVKSTFERGMDELAAELYTQKENAVATEVGPLVHTLRGATDEVRVAAEMLAASGGAPEKGGESASSLAELESRMDPTVALGALVDAGDFEGAFTKALGLSSVDTVAWVCSRADAKREAIFSSTPVALSQGVLLSLAQQLSSDLEEEPELKIAWVRDAALAIDPSDAALAQHMRPILESVFAGLHECATAPETPAPVKNDLRLCIHVVNSLLTACK